MHKELFNNFNSFLSVNRLIFEEAREAPTVTALSEAPPPADAAAADRVVAGHQEAGEAAYFRALEQIKNLRGSSEPQLEELVGFHLQYEKLKNPDAKRAFLKKVAERTLREAQTAYERDGNYAAFIKAYDLEGVGADGPKMEIVKAVLRAVAPGNAGFEADADAQAEAKARTAQEALDKVARQRAMEAGMDEGLPDLVEAYRELTDPEQQLDWLTNAAFRLRHFLSQDPQNAEKIILVYGLVGVNSTSPEDAIIGHFLSRIAGEDAPPELIAKANDNSRTGVFGQNPAEVARR